MNIQDFQSVMLPLMKYASDGKENTLREYLAEEFKLSNEERAELLLSGTQAIFDNRVGWAKIDLYKAGLLSSPRRFYFLITERGREVFKKNLEFINMTLLSQFPEYVNFTKSKKKTTFTKKEKSEDLFTENTPEETLEYSYQELGETLAEEVLEKVKEIS